MSNDATSPAAKFAADVLVAYLQRETIPAADLPRLARELRLAFETDTRPADAFRASPPPAAAATRVSPQPAPAAGVEAGEVVSLDSRRQLPAVPADESIHDTYLVSLEDGKRYRSLRRHLMAKHGLTPEAYRLKWGLPPDYPMVAPSYARERSEVAKRSGLGRTPKGDKVGRRRG